MPSLTPKQVGPAIAARIIKAMTRPAMANLLSMQAKRRIAARGDSTHRYPDLWKHPGSYRRGGGPLHDTGHLISSLRSTSTVRGNRVELRLMSPYRHALYHQHGFSTTGPNFIPLTRKAARNYTQWSRAISAHAKKERSLRRQLKTGRVAEEDRWERKKKALSGLTNQQKLEWLRTEKKRVTAERKAARLAGKPIKKFNEQATKDKLDKMTAPGGLVEGVDYIMAWNGVTVPQRKIFNMPPEDLAEIRATIAAVLR